MRRAKRGKYGLLLAVSFGVLTTLACAWVPAALTDANPTFALRKGGTQGRNNAPGLLNGHLVVFHDETRWWSHYRIGGQLADRFKSDASRKSAERELNAIDYESLTTFLGDHPEPADEQLVGLAAFGARSSTRASVHAVGWPLRLAWYAV